MDEGVRVREEVGKIKCEGGGGRGGGSELGSDLDPDTDPDPYPWKILCIRQTDADSLDPDPQHWLRVLNILAGCVPEMFLHLVSLH